MPQQQDACTLLDDDHKKVEQLFADYQSAGDDARKREIAHQVCMELLVHTQIEEEIFYPAFAQACNDKPLLDDANREHAQARQMMTRVEATPTDTALMQQLRKAIEHHVQDEREKMFPKARQSKKMDLAGLATRLQQRKAELMAQHQRQPA